MQWWEHARLARRWHALWRDGGLHTWVAGMLVVLLLLLGMLAMLGMLLVRLLAVRIHVWTRVMAVRAKMRVCLVRVGEPVGICVGRLRRGMLVVLVRGCVDLHVDEREGAEQFQGVARCVVVVAAGITSESQMAGRRDGVSLASKQASSDST